MNIQERLAEAWKAVEGAGIPTHLHELAFREALSALPEPESARGDDAGKKATKKRKPGTKDSSGVTDSAAPAVSEDDFFERLADEADVDIAELRQVIGYHGGRVMVIPAARKLGATKGDKNRTVIALVAGARHGGLGETPVNSDAVRAECKDRGVLDTNYAKHLDKVPGFTYNTATKTLVIGSQWDSTFRDALRTALGQEVEEPASA